MSILGMYILVDLVGWRGLYWYAREAYIGNIRISISEDWGSPYISGLDLALVA